MRSTHGEVIFPVNVEQSGGVQEAQGNIPRLKLPGPQVVQVPVVDKPKPGLLKVWKERRKISIF